MPDTLLAPEVKNAILTASTSTTRSVLVDGALKAIQVPFPSPTDWRDIPIYFVLLDRFNNPANPPAATWDQPFGAFQGGTFEGVRQKLAYIAGLGFRGIWLSPVQKNLQFEAGTYHGYGIHDFLEIEPRFSSNPANPALAAQELQALIDEAHARGLYVILDVVLNHTGNVFGYAAGPSALANSEHDFSINVLDVFWRDAGGVGTPPPSIFPAAPSRNAVVWPSQFHRTDFFRRIGKQDPNNERHGDFASLKEFVTDFREDGRKPVLDFLIRSYQYMVARFDFDAFRIDTLKHIEPDEARTFGNAMREFALSIGKRNFFTFGETKDDAEGKLAKFIGRNAREGDELVGVDAALDFPLAWRLAPYAKAQGVKPGDIASIYVRRKQEQQFVVSSHGDASRFFVTFLDNHDQHNFRFPPLGAAFERQFDLGIAGLVALQGIPCIYYGTEQGLPGMGTGGDLGVREALWGKPNGFSQSNRFYNELKELLLLRATHPALRYGRQYFRPVSGDGQSYGLSPFPNGILAVSRILNDREIVAVMNPNTTITVPVFVIVDNALNPANTPYQILYSNSGAPSAPGSVQLRHNTVVFEADGSVNRGSLKAVRVTLEPMEVQFIAS